MNLENLLAAACNPLRSNVDRKINWDAFERESWFNAVMTQGLRVDCLEFKFQDLIKALIVQRAHHMA